MECLIALGNSSISKSFLIRHILSEINAVADQLWQASQVNTLIPAVPALLFLLFLSLSAQSQLTLLVLLWPPDQLLFGFSV